VGHGVIALDFKVGSVAFERGRKAGSFNKERRPKPTLENGKSREDIDTEAFNCGGGRPPKPRSYSRIASLILSELGEDAPPAGDEAVLRAPG
jgi:hypothetical protein